MYDEADKMIKFAQERYSQDWIFYDNVEKMTLALLNNDYSAAQKIIDEIEKNKIKRAGKKSRWFKYRRG